MELKPATVGDVIALLSRFPRDAEVLLDCNPLYEPLAVVEGLPTALSPEKADFVVLHSINGKLTTTRALNRRTTPRRKEK